MWHTPPLSRVVRVDGIVRLVLTYLYLNAGNLSRIPHVVSVPRFDAYVDPSLRTPPGYGQSICLVHPPYAAAVCQTPVSASSSDLQGHEEEVTHAQNPL